MNKTAIKNFAVWARRKLISDITYKAGMLGITENGIAQPMKQSTKDLQFFDIGTKDYVEISGDEIQQRKAFADAIKSKERTSDYKTAFNYVVEEVAYTWFNRLIAVRFMEVNGYLPSQIRVLSSEKEGKLEPDFVTRPFDTDLDFTPYEKDIVLQLKEENKLDELFRMLFIKQCNKFSAILPELFEQISDYTELLLTISFTDKDGVIYHLTHDISEDDFNVEKEGQVEVIGWFYQYYISEKHEQVINILKGTVKKDDIPAATQLFTTDWVVRYMVDNSLGRYWIERHPESKLAEKLEFFVTSKDGHIHYLKDSVEPTEMTFFDPCMGSGHILVYAFDVLMDIYRECGYSDKEAAESIVENNLFGVDIDRRAYQLAYFAIMMKARQYSRRILTKNVRNNLASMEESNDAGTFYCAGLTTDKEMTAIGTYLFTAFMHAKEIGSLQSVENKDYAAFEDYVNCLESTTAQLDIMSSVWISTTLPKVRKFIKQAKILSNKYAVVCTNPPYMNKFEGHLKTFITEKYKDYSGDLFSAFMFRNFYFCNDCGYSAFMTPNVWFSAKLYEPLRTYIFSNKGIDSLVQIAKGAFYSDATVDVCAFVLKNCSSANNEIYIRLEDFKGDMDYQKEKFLAAAKDATCPYKYESNCRKFSSVPGSPISYWLSDAGLKSYEFGIMGTLVDTKQGFKTGNNDLFLRLWFEVDIDRMFLGADYSKKRWFPCNKGGDYRKWYGNKQYTVDWEKDGDRIIQYKDENGKQLSRPQNIAFNFKEALTWSTISSGPISFRYSDSNMMFESKGSECFAKDNKQLFNIHGYLNSVVAMYYLKALAQTIDYSEGAILKLPILKQVDVSEKVKKNISISKQDWDSFETSWDFKTHPLVPLAHEKKEQEESQFAISRIEKFGRISWHYEKWAHECEDRFNTLKANEEELNRIFIDIYGLQDELTPAEKNKDVTVRKAELQRDIKSLISYAVGCMFGRYSLDVPGLVYAGGKWVDSKYRSFIPDADNCIPITDEEYFQDDIVGRFVEFIRVAYGNATLEENLEFIAKALGDKGKTPRDTIRQYFLNDFFKDHCQTYSVTGSGKRPIYWLFDSGKQNGFKALVYMHRWDADTVGNLRVEYLHKMQTVYEKEIESCQDTIDNSMNNREIAAATKRKEKLVKQIKECKDYDAKVAHIALSRINIDLDDGVKVNYRKVQTGADGKFCEILADSKDIMAKEK